MTTDNPSLFAGGPALEHRLRLEHELGSRLARLDHWTTGLEPAVDWDLEIVLDEIRSLSIELRQLRGEESIPF